MSVVRNKGLIKYGFRLVGIMAATTMVSIFLSDFRIGKENTLMVFIVGVLLTSACTNGYEYGILASMASVLLFNYFFTAPFHSFAINNTNDWAMIFFFLAAALISSSLTMRFQKQLLIAQRNEQTARLLYEMSESFINVTGMDNIIQLGIQYIYEQTAFQSSVELEGPICRESDCEDTSNNYMMFPITGLVKRLGSLKVYNQNQGLSIEQELLIKTAANQIGIALDRELVYTEQQSTKIAMEKERMKSSMLRSISHDFRTPLTGIMGDCEVILETGGQDWENIKLLVTDVNEQADWLMKMMENILSMTRIESGRLLIKKQTEVMEDIIYEAVNHVTNLREHRTFTLSMPEDLILVEADGKLLEQVVINLLDNAVKHTKKGDKIVLKAFYQNGWLYVQIEDNGDGIAEEIADSLFQEFVSMPVESGDQKRGIGLGLAISRFVIEAHNGKIWGENRIEGGARFTFCLEARKVKTDGR